MELAYHDDAWEKISEKDIQNWNSFKEQIVPGCEIICTPSSSFKKISKEKKKDKFVGLKGIVLKVGKNGLLSVLVKKTFIIEIRVERVICVSKSANDCVSLGITNVF